MQKIRWWVASLLALTFVIPAQAGQKIWDKKFQDDIRYKKITDAGILLLMTDAGIVGVDPETGNELWSLPDLKKLKEEDIEYVAGSPLLMVSKTEGFVKKKGTLAAINTMDGKEAWKVDAIEGIIVGSNLALDHGIILLYVQNMMKGMRLDIMAFDMVNGALKYTVTPPEKMEIKKYKTFKPPKAGKFSSKMILQGNQEPVIDGDYMYVYYDQLRKIDLRDGKTVWVADTKKGGVPALQENYVQMVLRDGVIYTPYGKGLAAFDAGTGQLKWMSKPVATGHVTAMTFDGDRIYYKAGGYVEGVGNKAKLVTPSLGVVSMADGTMQWKKEYKIKGGCTNMIIEGDKIYVADSDNLRILNKMDGSELNKKFKLGFREDDPNQLMRQEKGLIVRGNQNVALVDVNGSQETVVWHQGFKAPGAGMFAKLAMFAVSTMAYMQATSDAMNSYRGTFENDAANRRRQQAWSGFNQVMAMRFTASKTSDQYHYILTDLDDGAGIKGVNLKTGQADRDALLKDKQPDYEIDEIGGYVFNQRGDKEIEAFKF